MLTVQTQQRKLTVRYDGRVLTITRSRARRLIVQHRGVPGPKGDTGPAGAVNLTSPADILDFISKLDEGLT